jgi:acetyl-CoA/propionyl-CoA carboxylase biotin carboxyl carrier protein
VRVDSGVRQGDTVSGAFDSLVAKLIVTGATREEALERSRRALDEFVVTGMPTVMPFHRDVVRQPAFTAEDGEFGVFTTWIETAYDNQFEPWDGEAEELYHPGERREVVVEVNDKRIEVSLPERLVISAGIEHGGVGRNMAGAPPRRRSRAAVDTTSGNDVTSPMQATIVKFAVDEGQRVVKGDLLVVLEAMKMEQPISASRDGVVRGIAGEPGQTISAGTKLLAVEDE